MTFDEPEYEKFKCLALAFKALEMGGTATTVLNAANEVAVEKFLSKEISFAAIPTLIEEALAQHTPTHGATFNEIVRIDAETRRSVELAAVH